MVALKADCSVNQVETQSRRERPDRILSTYRTTTGENLRVILTKTEHAQILLSDEF